MTDHREVPAKLKAEHTAAIETLEDCPKAKLNSDKEVYATSMGAMEAPHSPGRTAACNAAYEAQPTVIAAAVNAEDGLHELFSADVIAKLMENYLQSDHGHNFVKSVIESHIKSRPHDNDAIDAKDLEIRRLEASLLEETERADEAERHVHMAYRTIEELEVEHQETLNRRYIRVDFDGTGGRRMQRSVHVRPIDTFQGAVDKFFKSLTREKRDMYKFTFDIRGGRTVRDMTMILNKITARGSLHVYFRMDPKFKYY